MKAVKYWTGVPFDAGSTIVTVENLFDKTTHDVTIPLPPGEFAAAYKAWRNGTLIQRCVPTLTAEQRETLITGLTAEEQKEIFNEDDN